MNISKRAVYRPAKYALNLAGLLFMFYTILISFGLRVRPSSADISQVAEEVIPLYGLFLILSTGLNFVIETKLQRRTSSKEYLLLLCINAIVPIVFFACISVHHTS